MNCFVKKRFLSSLRAFKPLCSDTKMDTKAIKSILNTRTDANPYMPAE